MDASKITTLNNSVASEKESSSRASGNDSSKGSSGFRDVLESSGEKSSNEIDGLGVKDKSSSVSAGGEFRVHERSSEIGKLIITGPQSVNLVSRIDPSETDQMPGLLGRESEVDGESVELMKSVMLGFWHPSDHNKETQIRFPVATSTGSNSSLTLPQSEAHDKALWAKIDLADLSSRQEMALNRMKDVDALSRASDFSLSDSNVGNSRESLTSVANQNFLTEKYVRDFNIANNSLTVDSGGEVGMQQQSSTRDETNQEASGEQQDKDSSGSGEDPRNFAFEQWRERFVEALGEKLALGIREGSWDFKINLQDLNLGLVSITIRSNNEGLIGEIRPENELITKTIAESVAKLEDMLRQGVTQTDNKSVKISVIRDVSETDVDLDPKMNIIEFGPDDFAGSMFHGMKTDDGVDLFV